MLGFGQMVSQLVVKVAKDEGGWYRSSHKPCKGVLARQEKRDDQANLTNCLDDIMPGILSRGRNQYR